MEKVKETNNGWIPTTEPIASYCISNNVNVIIYDIRFGIEDEILAGINGNEPEWCVIKSEFDQLDMESEVEQVFYLDDYRVPLNECMRI